jgi:hypothetical protein
VTVLTESRRRARKLSGRLRRLGVRAVEDGGDTRRRGTRTRCATRGPVWWFGPQNHRMAGLVVWASKPSDGGFHRFGPQNLGGGPEARAELPRRDGRHVAASGSSRRSEATGEEARWPSDRIIPSRTKLALGLVVWLMYLGVVWRRGIRPI